MCGRYTEPKPKKTMLASLGLQADPWLCAPLQHRSHSGGVVALGQESTPERKRARWGFLPVWTKGATIPASLINARAETVASKPSFRHSYEKKRCLVLADGFYEWQKRSEGKQPIYIRRREGAPFAFGGLSEEWRGDERIVESFCIVTTLANELCGSVHGRMPLILREADFAAWLDAKTNQRAVDVLLRPYAAAEMECYAVSTAVNNVRNEMAACVERVKVSETAVSAQMLLF
jgi:putative SOS response-associated peptidase YedK